MASPHRARRRWPNLLAGFVVGWATGVTTLLVLAGMSVRLASHSGPAAGTSDIQLQIHSGYLNDVVRRRMSKNPPLVVADIKTTDLQLGLAPQASLVLTPTFDVAGFFQVSPTVNNQLSVQDGKLAMQMIGDPRLGDLQVPIDMLPFDLAGEVRRAVDRITNELLLTEVNTDLRAGFGNDTFDITEVQTAGDYLAIKLHRK